MPTAIISLVANEVKKNRSQNFTFVALHKILTFDLFKMHNAFALRYSLPTLEKLKMFPSLLAFEMMKTQNVSSAKRLESIITFTKLKML